MKNDILKFSGLYLTESGKYISLGNGKVRYVEEKPEDKITKEEDSLSSFYKIMKKIEDTVNYDLSKGGIKFVKGKMGKNGEFKPGSEFIKDNYVIRKKLKDDPSKHITFFIKRKGSEILMSKKEPYAPNISLPYKYNLDKIENHQKIYDRIINKDYTIDKMDVTKAAIKTNIDYTGQDRKYTGKL